ncbi:MAG TPA: AAA family ATPase [Candidatus Angelobacter sp.]|nr:AAA family ATPase [Candidatus Angelobacter sp.]
MAVHRRSPSLVERDEALDELQGFLEEAAAGSGRVVFVRGEAGIGKTVLVSAILERARSRATVAVGWCDGVSTPRTLGPVHDMARDLGDELGALLAAGTARDVLFDWLLRRLSNGTPSVALIEDAQWSDDVTLDLIRFLARRIASHPILLLVTLRDDARTTDSVAVMLGEVATAPAVRHLRLGPLSADGVAALAAGSRLDPADLHRVTGGNPFLVGEIVASGSPDVPATVRDAVRARYARLPERSRRVLEAAAAIGNRVDPWLLAAMTGEDLPGLDACIEAGLLVKADVLEFRHELTRLAVIEDLPVVRGIALHRTALEALTRAGSSDEARLAYHAEGAAIGSEVVTHALAAGRAALAAGAHRAAIAQLERALRFAGNAAAPDRADILEPLGRALYLVNRVPEARSRLDEAVAIRRRLGDDLRAADDTRQLAWLAWLAGEHQSAMDLAYQAAGELEPHGPSRELALAAAEVGRLHMIRQESEARAWATRALELGRAIGDSEVIAHALITLGSEETQRAWVPGRDQIAEGLSVARQHGFPELVFRALYNLCVGTVSMREPELAEQYLVELAEVARPGEIARCSLDSMRASINLERGTWEAALRHATAALDDPLVDPYSRNTALLVRARIALRRGSPDAKGDVELALGSAAPDLVQERLDATSLRAEAAWLGGRPVDLADLAKGAAVASTAEDAWMAADLARWRWLAGETIEGYEQLPEPFALLIAGRSVEAAAIFDARGAHYEAAFALACSAAPADLVEAHRRLAGIGATATAHRVAGRLKELGTPVPRGPRASTRSNPGSMTARESEVAALVAEGLTNAEIAQRLVLSERTVAHHVSAVLGKLGVRRRADVRPGLATVAPEAATT